MQCIFFEARDEAKSSLKGRREGKDSHDLEKLRMTAHDNSNETYSMVYRYTILAAAVLIWYAASAVANTSSRKILNITSQPVLLTLMQFMAATTFLHIYFFFRSPRSITRHEIGFSSMISAVSNHSKISGSNRINNRIPLLLFRLSAVYTLGFLFVNAGYVVVNVSLAETLRSAEPLVSVFLAKCFLTSESTSKLMFVSMIPIFVGGCLSSASDTTFSVVGLVFVTASNISFALRSLITKQIKEQEDMELKMQQERQTIREDDIVERKSLASSTNLTAFELFYVVSKTGSIFLAVILCLQQILGLNAKFGGFGGFEEFPSGRNFNLLPNDQDEVYEMIRIVAVNVVAYFLYNQMSFFVLSQVSMVTHAVANALRRIVTIIFSVWYFRNRINVVNGAGIFLAISGVLLYSFAKSKAKIKSSKTSTIIKPVRQTTKQQDQPELQENVRLRSTSATSPSPSKSTSIPTFPTSFFV